MRKAIVNFASGRWYPRGQVRLQKSLRDTGFDGKFFGFQDTKLIGGPLHQKVPYAFKIYSIKYAWTHGFDAIIYADASIWAVRPWNPVWEIVESQGYYFEEAGQWSGTWTKDGLLNKMGVTRNEAMEIPMLTAGFTCLNMQSDIGKEFFKEWWKYADDNYSFCGTWGNENRQMSRDPRCKGHRHDMSVASILAHKMGMKLGKGGTFLAYIGPAYNKPKDSVIAYLQPC